MKVRDIISGRWISGDRDINNTAFENINTEEKAYFLGWMISDGNISKNRNRITLELQKQDISIIHRFRKFLNIQTKICDVERKLCTNGYKHICSNYKTYCDSIKLKNDLNKYGVIPNKSLKAYVPVIDENLLPHLLRGIMEGDGSIYQDKYKNWRVQFLGTKQLCKDVQNIFNNKLNLPKHSISRYKKIYRTTWCKKEHVHSILSYLYNNASLDLVLPRKYERVKICLGIM